MTYTLKDIRETALDVAGLTDTKSIGGYDPVQRCQMFLRQAHEVVQREIRKLDPAMFVRDSRFTYPANALKVGLDAALDVATYGRIDKIRAVGLLQYDADPSVTNVPVPVNPYAGGRRGGVTPTLSFAAGSFSGPGGLTVQTFGGSQGSRMGWLMQNREMYLLPTPNADSYVYVEWVPVMPFDTDTALCLGGWMPEGELLVAYKAAALMATFRGLRDGVAKASALYDDGIEALAGAVQKRPADHGFMRLTHPDTHIQKAGN